MNIVGQSKEDWLGLCGNGLFFVVAAKCYHTYLLKQDDSLSYAIKLSIRDYNSIALLTVAI